MDSCITRCSKPLKFRLCFLLGCATTLILIGVSSVFLYYPNTEHQLDSVPGKAQRNVAISGFSRVNNPFSQVIETGRKTEKFPQGEQGKDQGSTTPGEEAEKIRHYQHERLQFEWNDETEIQASNFSKIVRNRLIHFDLKGAPPKVPYLKEIILLAKEAGITGVLLEWEDTFPWTKNLQNVTLTRGGYSLGDVKEIVGFAESQGLDAIPLVQTFGHVEFILKGEEFAHLRELEGDPQAFCPSKVDTIQLIEEMIEQIVSVHSNSKFIHIGCDEVFTLRLCPRCIKNSESGDTLFLHHVATVAKIVHKHGKIPIMWDDMLRSISEVDLLDSKIGSLVEVMIWVYADEVDRYVGFDSWEKYAKLFPTIWVAGAFKGSSGETTQIPSFSRHVENTLQWLDVIRRESSRWYMGLGGFVLTGWSRYDHFAVMCELLPAAIPSLVYNALMISTPTPDDAPTFIRNRIFIPRNSSLPFIAKSDSTPAEALRRMRKRSARRWMPHPQTLRKNKEAEYLQPHNPHTSGGINENLTPAMLVRNEIVWKEFSSILRCPSPNSRFTRALRDTNDTQLRGAGKCNWNGVNVFRSLFHLRDLIIEVRDVEASIKYKRGWLTDYNIQHNYTLPLRLDELLGGDIPRLKRNLALKAKSLGLSLKPIYVNEVILEWIEQNVWTHWKDLSLLEEIGEELKGVKYWARRPIKTPIEMYTDLGLHPIQLQDKKEL